MPNNPRNNNDNQKPNWICYCFFFSELMNRKLWFIVSLNMTNAFLFPYHAHQKFEYKLSNHIYWFQNPLVLWQQKIMKINTIIKRSNRFLSFLERARRPVICVLDNNRAILEGYQQNWINYNKIKNKRTLSSNQRWKTNRFLYEMFNEL